MPITKRQKGEIIDKLSDKLNKSRSVVFVDYKGLKVKEIEQLRLECGRRNSEYLVAKKTLIKLAVDKNKIEGVNPKEIKGNLGLVFSYKDEVTSAKIAKDASNKYETLKMLGGIMGGRFIDEQIVKNLANIPSKLELRAKLVGSLNSSIFGFVNILRGNLRRLIYTLDAIRREKYS